MTIIGVIGVISFLGFIYLLVVTHFYSQLEKIKNHALWCIDLRRRTSLLHEVEEHTEPQYSLSPADEEVFREIWEAYRIYMMNFVFRMNMQSFDQNGFAKSAKEMAQMDDKTFFMATLHDFLTRCTQSMRHDEPSEETICKKTFSNPVHISSYQTDYPITDFGISAYKILLSTMRFLMPTGKIYTRRYDSIKEDIDRRAASFI